MSEVAAEANGQGPGSGPQRQTEQALAAIDLGSNSFHMVVARVVDGQIVIVDRMKEMVQLAAGLTDARKLRPDAQQRALVCLERFGQRVRQMPQESVRVVGTNTLRVAKDSEAFLERAEEALGQPIEIINGIEEARLIYLGVAHGLGASNDRRLVIDIGGGSTELVIGEGFTPLDMESLYMGCVVMMARHFPDGRISAKRFRRAEVTALQELERVQERFRRLGWKAAIGASGTIRAVASVVASAGWGRQTITKDGLRKLRSAIIDAESVDKIALPGLSRSRISVFPGGVAILSALFESLEVDEMRVSDSALREGLLNDLLGRFQHRDVRNTTVEALMDRYHVDRGQTARVERTLLALLPQVIEQWSLPRRRSEELCSWSARLHESGLDIAHSHYHKHGGYVLENADMPGFSRQEQWLLATLVRAHRRKFPTNLFKSLPTKGRIVEHLAVLLRLAVLLHRSRTDVPDMTLVPGRRSLSVKPPSGWLDAHPLTQADLLEEAELLKTADFELKIVGNPALQIGD
ncbi:MAG TPA: exopolyphosphatase [Polyangiaceae bacterium]|jgi:exopolyphosphatase/guanosine-5'-triphosphate,3'-diphosphate pyrophosphatase|nr:exopolyphosphatase [Polyangiaceae bacterium]